jgi:hypothetical protein
LDLNKKNNIADNYLFGQKSPPNILINFKIFRNREKIIEGEKNRRTGGGGCGG